MVVVSMPRRDFDPETLRILSAAIERAWQSLEDSGSMLVNQFRAASTRERLARCIINLAQSGERDVDRLQRLATAAVRANIHAGKEEGAG
jgi:hypothetical protein